MQSAYQNAHNLLAKHLKSPRSGQDVQNKVCPGASGGPEIPGQPAGSSRSAQDHETRFFKALAGTPLHGWTQRPVDASS